LNSAEGAIAAPP